MSAYVPSEAEVEAAARALYDVARTVMRFPTGWGGAPEPLQQTYRTMARAALVAAHTVTPTPREDVAADALRAAADEFSGKGIRIWEVPVWLRRRADALATDGGES